MTHSLCAIFSSPRDVEIAIRAPPPHECNEDGAGRQGAQRSLSACVLVSRGE